MMQDRFLKRLRKKARKGLRGWPIATVAFYGPNLSQATKVTVGIVPSENAEVEDRFVLGRRLHGQIGRLLAFEDAIDAASARRNWSTRLGA